MDFQDHTNPTTPSPVSESHGVYVCRRCGWPFPNPHPSSKHRRAHKRVCGTIEGYTKLIHSSEAVSDDEHHSDDEDKEKTPNATNLLHSRIDARKVENKGPGEEAAYLHLVPSDIPLVDNAEALIEDFKDHKTKHSSFSLSLDPVGNNDENLESDHKHALEVVKEAELDHSVPVLSEDPVLKEQFTQETVKEPEKGIEVSQKIVASISDDLKDTEKAEDCGVAASVGSSSRNSLEGNWGSVSVLSTASIDAENSQSIGKSEIAADKSRFGKSDAMVELKEETFEDKASELNTVAAQISQPPKPEANETKRNKEAIAKVTNWSPVRPTTTPKQLSNTIQKDEASEKISEPGKSNLAVETPQGNQESSPLECIGEGKKGGKKTKGRASWIPFVCCSSVNVS